MRLIINLVLIALVGLLCYVLYSSIKEPIAFNGEKEKRKNAVIDRLMEARQAQEIYRDVTGMFASDWDSLNYVLQTGKIQNVSVFGDPDDPNFDISQIRYDTTYQPAMERVNELGLNLDSIRFIPFGGGASFDIAADTISYQSTQVNVVQVGTEYKKFMGPYANPRFARYDNTYDPNATIKFGDMSAPNTAGNWER